MTDTPVDRSWWVISAERLLLLLTRAHEGEDPGLIAAEEYANADSEDYRQ